MSQHGAAAERLVVGVSNDEEQFHDRGGPNSSMPCGAAAAAMAAGSGACGTGRTRARAGSPTARTKPGKPPFGTPCGDEVSTNTRAVSVTTANECALPRGANTNEPGVQIDTSPSTSNSISPSST